MNAKNIFYWFLGSVSILFGSVIASSLALDNKSHLAAGQENPDLWIALIVALGLVMFGGFLWIGIAVGLAEEEEEFEILGEE